MLRAATPDDCSGRLFQSSCAGLLLEVAQLCDISYFQLVLVMSLLHFFPLGTHWGFHLSQSEEALRTRHHKKYNQQAQPLASYPGKQIQAQMISNKGHFDAFTQSRGTRSRWRCANIYELFPCCERIIIRSNPNDWMEIFSRSARCSVLSNCSHHGQCNDEKKQSHHLFQHIN